MTILRTASALTTAAAIGLSTLGAPTASATGHAARSAPDSLRGDLLSVHELPGLSERQVLHRLRTAGWDASRVEHGVDAYRIGYRTVGVDGTPTRASGLVVLPRDAPKRLRAVSYTHGTTSYKPDVASTFRDSFLVSPALTYGSAGFAAVLPDYLGLGKGPGNHPWMHVPSETTASVDMLRAARQLAHRRGHELRRRAYLTGFSQGASAALGLARALQRAEHRWFRVGAVAPISGAYDLADVELPALLRGRLHPRMSVAYTAYFLVAWNRLHDLYERPAQVFRRPYAGRVDRLFDGNTPGNVMLRELPSSVDGLLTRRGKRLLAEPTPRLRRAIRVADGVCKNWTPRRPVRLLVARNDEQAATANTFSCHRSLRARGASAPVADLGEPSFQGSRHLGTNVAGTAAAARWFLRLER